MIPIYANVPSTLTKVLQIPMSRIKMDWPRLTALMTALLLILLPAIGLAETEPAESGSPVDNTLVTLTSFVDLKKDLKRDINRLNKQLRTAQSDAEKKGLKQQLDKLETDLLATTRNFEDIAAGVDISSLRKEEQRAFDFQREVFALLKPALDEMKSMTAEMRQKSEFKERITYYQKRLPVIEQALANTDRLQMENEEKALAESLKETAGAWGKQRTFIQSELQAAQLQLDKLVAAETSFSKTSQSYLKSFFQKRGLYLTEALLVVIGIMLLSRLSGYAMQRFLPGFKKPHRSFRIRLIELIHHILTILLVIMGPMAVFYLMEDWVLFSLGLLLLIGMAWTLRQYLPRYWQQIRLFLDIGAVREGERIFLDGLPWQIQQINVHCTLVNPVADISQRVPIDNMVDLKSRPCGLDEPWFPCKKGDWVILSDSVRGKVIGISPEMVQLEQRGGAIMTYLTGDFLAASPRNLATNFRLKEILGISYSLQKESTTTIPETLHSYIQQRIHEEGYGEQLLNLRVEFAQANSSSLDLVIIADFQGELGDRYNRLRRAIQRWSVDACTKYGWEIPYPQMTLHQD